MARYNERSTMNEIKIRDKLVYLSKRHNDLNRLIDSQNKRQTISDSRLKWFKYARRELKIQMTELEEKLKKLIFESDSTSQKIIRIYPFDFVVKKEENDFTVL